MLTPSHLLRAYNQVIVTYPTLSMAILTGSMMGFGNFISQIATTTTSDTKARISFGGVMQFTSYGFFVAGPLMHHWFIFLNRSFRHSRAKSLKMVITDQLFMCPIGYSAFTLYNYWWNGKDIAYVRSHLKQDTVAILFDNYKVWPLIQFVNFNLIPLKHRVLFMNTAALFWNAYVAWLFKSKINRNLQAKNLPPTNNSNV